MLLLNCSVPGELSDLQQMAMIEYWFVTMSNPIQDLILTEVVDHATFRSGVFLDAVVSRFHRPNSSLGDMFRGFAGQ